jgi:hypothetical protein
VYTLRRHQPLMKETAWLQLMSSSPSSHFEYRYQHHLLKMTINNNFLCHVCSYCCCHLFHFKGRHSTQHAIPVRPITYNENGL